MKRHSLRTGLLYLLTSGQAWALNGRCSSPSLSGSLLKDSPLLLVTGIVVGGIAAALWAFGIRLIRIGSEGQLQGQALVAACGHRGGYRVSRAGRVVPLRTAISVLLIGVRP